MTDEQVIRVLAEFEYPKMEIDGECLFLKAEFFSDVIDGAPYFPIPDYLGSLDALRPVVKKLYEVENLVVWAILRNRFHPVYSDVRYWPLPCPEILAHDLAQAIVEAELVEVQ